MTERRYREIFENAPAMYVVTRARDTSFVVDECNRCFYDVLGYQPADVVGRPLTDFLVPEGNGGSARGLPAVLTAKDAAIEQALLAQDGRILHVLALSHPVLDERQDARGYLTVFVDDDTRNAADAALRSSNERFRAAFDNAPIGLAIVTPDGQFREVNRALCQLVGYAEAELLGMAPADITDIEDVDDELELFARLWAGEMEHFQLNERYVHKGGHSIWVELTVSAVEERPGKRYAITQVQDVSARHRLEMERATMLSSERAYARQVRELAAIRVDLTRIVSHELRAPVAALRMMLTALATGELSARDQQETYQAFQSQIDQLDRLVQDVAAVATAEREDFAVQFHDVPLPVLLAGARAFAASALDGHPVSIPDGGQIHVWCDPDRISQVLRNLLENAARHTPAGTPVAIRVHQHGDLARIEVSDQGDGVPDEDQSIMFEKFARGRVAIDSQQPGAGLGLYLSREIVHAHGAELSYTAGPDGGATFGFDLRLVQ